MVDSDFSEWTIYVMQINVRITTTSTRQYHEDGIEFKFKSVKESCNFNSFYYPKSVINSSLNFDYYLSYA